MIKNIKQYFIITAFLSSLSAKAMQDTSKKTGEDYSKQSCSLLGQIDWEGNNEESLIKTSDLEDTYMVAEFNDSDLLPFNFEGQHELAKRTGIPHFPAAAHFYKEGNECLRYIAVAHAAGPKPSSTEPGHPTFIMVQEAIATYKPDFVIAEGFTNEPHFLEHIA